MILKHLHVLFYFKSFFISFFTIDGTSLLELKDTQKNTFEKSDLGSDYRIILSDRHLGRAVVKTAHHVTGRRDKQCLPLKKKRSHWSTRRDGISSYWWRALCVPIGHCWGNRRRTSHTPDLWWCHAGKDSSAHHDQTRRWTFVWTSWRNYFLSVSFLS